MSTVTPPPPTPPPTGPQPAPQVVVTVPNPPAGLAGEAAQARIEAVVAHRLATADGGTRAGADTTQLVLQTAFGRITAEAPAALPRDTPILLQLLSTARDGALRFQIVTVDGKPPSTVPGLTARPPASGIPGTTTSSAGVPGTPDGAAGGGLAGRAQATPAATTAPRFTATVSLTQGSTQLATLLTPGRGIPAAPGQAPGTPAPVAPAIQPAAPGSGPAGLVSGGMASPGAAAPGGQRTPASGGAPTPAMPAGSTAGQTVSPQGSQGSPAGVELPAGTRFPVTIQGLTPPPSQGSPAPPPSPPRPAPVVPGQTITGVVTGATPQGQSLVQTHVGIIALGADKALPTGTTLELKVDGPPVPPESDVILHGTERKTAMITSRTWPALDEALHALEASNPNLAQQVSSTTLPQPGSQLTSTILFFLSALRGGDVAGWLGEPALRAIQRARPDVIQRLAEDFRMLGGDDENRPVVRTAGADWRAALIPLHDGDTLTHLRLMLRDQGAGDDGGSDGELNGKRFLIDLSLSRIGRIQLDGLLTGGDKNLDLVMRTQSPLPDAMRRDLLSLFTRTNEATGMAGGMSFQSSPRSFVELEPETPPHGERDGGIVV